MSDAPEEKKEGKIDSKNIDPTLERYHVKIILNIFSFFYFNISRKTKLNLIPIKVQQTIEDALTSSFVYFSLFSWLVWL